MLYSVLLMFDDIRGLLLMRYRVLLMFHDIRRLLLMFHDIGGSY